MLRFDSVSKSLETQPVLRDVSFTLAPGELAVVVGPSGVGKSTLLRLAAGLLTPCAGHVARGFKRPAMVFQEPRLVPWLDARDNAALPLADRAAAPIAHAHAERLLQRLGLGPEDWRKQPGQLSGGMQARVAIARALAIDPDLLLLDEPFAALDAPRRQDLQRLTRAVIDEQGAAALFVTHDLAEATRLADRILVLAETPGRLLADLPHTPCADQAEAWRAAAALLERPAFAKAFPFSSPAKDMAR